MQIKFWGCRGSIPVPDARMMRYGGNTTCVEVTAGGRTLIIDAGTGIRKLGEELMKRRVSSFDLVISHSHWDHIQGFPFFTPIYSRRSKINILGCTDSYRRLKTILAHQMSVEYFPVNFSDLTSTIAFTGACDNLYRTKGYTLRMIRTNHAIYTLGLRVEEGDRSFVFITDNELRRAKPDTSWEEFVTFCRGADCLVHDAQFTDAEYATHRGWGHSTYEDVIRLARAAGVKRLGFFHHDPNRRDDELDALERRFKRLCRAKKYPFDVFTVKEMDLIELG